MVPLSLIKGFSLVTVCVCVRTFVCACARARAYVCLCVNVTTQDYQRVWSRQSAVRVCVCARAHARVCANVPAQHVFMCVNVTGWRRLIECLKLQVICCKRATNYRALLQKMTYKDKVSYGSAPPCTTQPYQRF